MSGAGASSASSSRTKDHDVPLIPESVFDVPSQRLYLLSLGAFMQAAKFWSFVQPLLDPTAVSQASLKLLLQWSFFDSLYLWTLPTLRIPRLRYSKRARLAQTLFFISLNYLMFGDYALSLGTYVPRGIYDVVDAFRYDELSTTERRVKVRDVVDQGSHLLGQHTVRLSPINTAVLNPNMLSYCLAPPHNVVLIPVLLNNTRPTSLQYSLTPFEATARPQYIDVSLRELQKIEAFRKEQEGGRGITFQAEDDQVELDLDDDYVASQRINDMHLFLEKSQTLHHIRVNRPGILRLEKVVDSKQSEVRIRQTETTIVECPTAAFLPDSLPPVQCVGSNHELSLRVKGSAPMTLRWYRDVQGKREQFVVEGIDSPAAGQHRSLATQEVTIPIPISLNKLGEHKYSLDTLSDAVGNSIDLSLHRDREIYRSVNVLRKGAVSFQGCSGSHISLLKGQEAKLSVALKDVDTADGPWTITIKFTPSGSKKTGWTKDFTTPPQKKDMEIAVGESGDYTITRVQGKLCNGEILSPETCKVIEQPLPSAEINFQTIHECSGDTGVAASLILHGTPPFVVFYKTQRNREAPKELVRTLSSSRGEITMQPETSGDYTYTFTALSDRNYRKVPLNGPSIRQVVHPLASAEFVRSGSRGDAGKTLVNSCSGNMVDVELELRGTPPWNVELQIVDPSGSRTFQAPTIERHRETLKIPIPDSLNETDGTFQIDLVSVTDANGCKKSLGVPGISVAVKRVKPTARFYSSDTKFHVTTLAGEEAQLPLRLTGEGPWSLTYRLLDQSNSVKHLLVTSPNDHLNVRAKGRYELISVRDKHCPGEVSENASKYEVDWVPKPAVRFAPSAGALATNDTIMRSPICVGVDDHAEIDLQGAPPFSISYSYVSGDNQVGERATLNSLQTQARLQLRTSVPGRHVYQLLQVGDAAYPLSKDTQQYGSNAPPVRGFSLEQYVLARPTAKFKYAERSSYCLNDVFAPRRTDGQAIVFSGTPPFVIELSIKNLASSEVYSETIEVQSYEWKVNLPQYTFKNIGPHLVRIESLRDASGCAPASLDSMPLSYRVDVAEIAAIVPLEHREDFCVGDVLHFQLEGTPPWRVQYRFNGKLTTATAKSSKFSRVAESPGDFEIVSIAQTQNLCQNTVSDVRTKIHALPSARVSQGKKMLEHIREGDQAEIIFSLRGEPPFTFTYQRTELPTSKRPPKVVETHTVSGVMNSEYSIFSAQEGTWTVSFISDKYCRYPVVASDSRIEKA